MEFGGQAIWAVLITIGVIVLAAAMTYGILRNRNRTLSEKITTERETKRVYEREDRDPDVLGVALVVAPIEEQQDQGGADRAALGPLAVARLELVGGVDGVRFRRHARSFLGSDLVRSPVSHDGSPRGPPTRTGYRRRGRVLGSRE